MYQAVIKASIGSVLIAPLACLFSAHPPLNAAVSKGCSQRRFTGEDLAERGTSAERWRRHFPRSPGSWSATASHPGAGSKVELWALPPAFIPSPGSILIIPRRISGEAVLPRLVGRNSRCKGFSSLRTNPWNVCTGWGRSSLPAARGVLSLRQITSWEVAKGY